MPPSQAIFLNRLIAPGLCALQFAFGLEPIIQIASRLFATFQIDFVRAVSNFLVGHWIPDLRGSYFGFYASRCFR
jgi:hypothetical protein